VVVVNSYEKERTVDEGLKRMARENINDLVAFIAVARERSFTKAAAKLGVSQSALSHTMRELESRFGIRLLMRTTRIVSPTNAGEALLNDIAPHFDGIDAALDGLQAKMGEPVGTIWITASNYSIEFAMWSRIKKFLAHYLNIKIERSSDKGLMDIVSERSDAGVRLSEQVAKDMISVPIGPDVRIAVVGSNS